uniref:Disease resistance protein RPM1 n=1 Tax=Aegilops tauschii TaxID=37682 RepID=M8BSG0_AEGTA
MEGAAHAIVSNIGQLVGEEFQQLRGVGGEVARLRDELATMNALLRMQAETEEDTVDHFVREWLKQLREVGYDAQDCVGHYLAADIRALRAHAAAINEQHARYGVSLESLRRPPSNMPTVRASAHVFHLHHADDPHRALRAHAAAINEQHARYGVSLESLRRPPSNMPTVRASAHVFHLHHADDPHRFVGIKEQASGLEDKVKAASDTTDVKVFSIVGFGGLGKTTLVMEVCRQLEADFERQAQVSVSQVLDLKVLLRDVLHQIVKLKAADRAETVNQPLAGIDSMNIEQLRKNIHSILTKKRYLIVIDDVWTEVAWNSIRSMLPDNDLDSRIIVTTRIETVAKACSYAHDDYIHPIAPLNEDNSKKLFLRSTFGSINASCPEDLKDSMEKVLKRCGGLPLAIVSIGSLLAGYRSPESKYMWETVLKSLGSQIDNHPTLEGMRRIITLSYDHLPHHLKNCMMYLSIFPEDFLIAKDRLLRRWISEGLVAEKRGLTLMEIAEGYFNELVSRSMIDRAADRVTDTDGREQMCRVHDMMLEVMVSKSLEANFVSLLGEAYEGMSYDRVRRLSIHGGVETSSKMAEEHGRKNEIKGMNVKHVRSLSMFALDGHNLLNQLDEFTLLRVLDLENCRGLGKSQMDYICRMYLLRFLNLKGTDVSVIPSKIDQLEHLQTLDVRATRLEDLPKTVTNLEKLESLLYSNKERYWDFHWEAPKGLRKMKALRKVNNLTVRSNIDVIEEIGELEQLEELDISVIPEIDQAHHDKLDESLSRLYSLRCLNLQIVTNTEWKKNFLQNLKSTPPRLLRYVRLCGTLQGNTGVLGVPTLTNWVSKLTNLVEFAIAWAHLRGDTLFDVLSKLPNLKTLTLEISFYSEKKIVARTSHKFPALTELRMDGVRSVPEVYEFEKGSMENLETIFLSFGCYKQRTVGIEHLTNLKEVQLTGKKDNQTMVDTLKELEEENVRRERNGSNLSRVKMHQQSQLPQQQPQGQPGIPTSAARRESALKGAVALKRRNVASSVSMSAGHALAPAASTCVGEIPTSVLLVRCRLQAAAGYVPRRRAAVVHANASPPKAKASTAHGPGVDYKHLRRHDVGCRDSRHARSRVHACRPPRSRVFVSFQMLSWHGREFSADVAREIMERQWCGDKDKQLGGHMRWHCEEMALNTAVALHAKCSIKCALQRERG